MGAGSPPLPDPAGFAPPAQENSSAQGVLQKAHTTRTRSSVFINGVSTKERLTSQSLCLGHYLNFPRNTSTKEDGLPPCSFLGPREVSITLEASKDRSGGFRTSRPSTRNSRSPPIGKVTVRLPSGRLSSTLDSTLHLPRPQRVPQRIDAEVSGGGLGAKGG
jgi:hypothetical protein